MEKELKENKEQLSHDEERELLKRIADGDEEALNKFVAANMGLVYFVVNRRPVKKDKRHDLISLGQEGLLSAVKTFSPEKGKFSTYAVTCIQNAINGYKNDIIKAISLDKEVGEEENQTVGDFIEKKEVYDKSAKEVIDIMQAINTPEEHAILLARNDITYDAESKKYEESMKGIKTSKEIAEKLHTSERNVIIRSAMGQKRLEGRADKFGLMDKQVFMLQISPSKDSNTTYLAWRGDLKKCSEIKFLKDEKKIEISSKEIVVFKKISFPEGDEDYIEDLEHEVFSHEEFENKYVINAYLTKEQARKKKGEIYGK